MLVSQYQIRQKETNTAYSQGQVLNAVIKVSLEAKVLQQLNSFTTTTFDSPKAPLMRLHG